MKSRPASRASGNRSGRVVFGVVLSICTVLSVWLFASSSDGQVQRALGADLARVAMEETAATVATVPTEPTVATVATVPTDATVTATSVPGDTPTPTKTPVPAGDDKKLTRLSGPNTGNYCVVSGGVGLTDTSSDSFALTIDGTVKEAYFIWSGRYQGAGNGDHEIVVSINGSTPTGVLAAVSLEAFSGWTNHNHYTYRSAELSGTAFGPLLTGNIEVTISGLKSLGTESDQGHGAGLIVVYENANNCPNSQVDLFFGLDGFHHRFTPPFGPNSEVVCVDLPAAATARTLEFQLFVGGAEGGRPNAVWYGVGSGPKPLNLIDTVDGIELDGPDTTGQPALTANVGQQWDNYTNSIIVPAGATFACFQLESVVPDSIGAIQESDGLPIDIIFDTAPYGTSGLWVSMASHLLPNFVPTATPTVTNTPLPATATATATATNTPVTPVATATATATATNTPVVSGPTPTMTNTPVVSGPTPTPTVTKTPTSCTPSVTITITHKPNPAHPGQRLTYYINFQVNNCGVKGLTFHLTIPLHTEYTGDTSRMAGWQCTAATGGSSCDLAFGDLAPNGSSVLEFPVTVDSNTPLGTTLFLNVTATDADGNSHSGISGVDYNVTVEPVIIYIPVVNNTPR